MQILAARDALLLLPVLPSEVAVLGSHGPWPAALSHWRVVHVNPGTGARLVITRSPRAAATCGAPVVLLVSSDRHCRLHRAGYSVVTYRARALPDGAVVVASGRDRSALKLIVRQAHAGLGRRSRLRQVLRRRSAQFTVATRRPESPGVLAAAAIPPSARFCLTVAGDARRRAVFLVTPSAGDKTDRVHAVVVKAARSPDEEDRPRVEQEVLRRLHARGLSAGLPAPLGFGTVGRVAWSAESAVRGRTLAEVLPTARADEGRALLARLADWLGDLATATSGPVAGSAVDDVLPLPGLPLHAAGLERSLGDVPGVLVHGDLASGLNVLVDDAGAHAVLDWETAREGGLPIIDLLPLLCTGLARLRGLTDPRAEADWVLSLACGHQPESAWLFAQVRTYAVRLDLRGPQIGALAALAWAYQGSMRGRHDALLTAAGLPAPPWTSAAELVGVAWPGAGGPGLAWPALGAP